MYYVFNFFYYIIDALPREQRKPHFFDMYCYPSPPDGGSPEFGKCISPAYGVGEHFPKNICPQNTIKSGGYKKARKAFSALRA